MKFWFKFTLNRAKRVKGSDLIFLSVIFLKYIKYSMLFCLYVYEQGKHAFGTGNVLQNIFRNATLSKLASWTGTTSIHIIYGSSF